MGVHYFASSIHNRRVSPICPPFHQCPPACFALPSEVIVIITMRRVWRALVGRRLTWQSIILAANRGSLVSAMCGPRPSGVINTFNSPVGPFKDVGCLWASVAPFAPHGDESFTLPLDRNSAADSATRTPLRPHSHTFAARPNPLRLAGGRNDRSCVWSLSPTLQPGINLISRAGWRTAA